MGNNTIKLLLIEDNEDDALIVRETLRRVKGDQFDLEWADRLSTGLERLAEGGIDVVLLDLALPDSRGLDTFCKARATVPDAPILVLTGNDDEAIGVQAVRAGAQDYLPKGQMDGNLLARSLSHAIERHRMRAELEQQAQELQASETRLRTIIEQNSDGIIVVDGNGIVRFVNPAAEALLGRQADELLGEVFGFPVVVGEATEIEIVRRGREGGVAEMRVVEIELRGEALFMVSLHDITERVRLREELRDLTLTDELTGLYNRRGFSVLGQQQLRLAKRTKSGMLLLFADLDDMKRINDTLGHHESDRALIETAQVLRETFRESDIVARFGGDEFAVLAIEASGDSVELISDRLQENLEAHNTGDNRRYDLSLSFGLACYDPQNPCSIGELMSNADARMYEHKRSKQQLRLCERNKKWTINL